MLPIDTRHVIVRHPGTNLLRVGTHLRQLAECRDLFVTLTEHRIRVRYKQSALGFAWAVLQPLSMMLIFTLVFGRIARVDTGDVPYPLFAFAGLLVWSFMSTSLTSGTHALVSHAQLITKVMFPREVLPLSYVAVAAFDCAVGSVVLLVLLLISGRPITWHLALAIVPMAMAAALATALAFALSAAQVRFRDVGVAVPLALYLWMFATPIAYPLAMVPLRYRRAFALNPLTGIIETFRAAALERRVPSFELLMPAVVACVFLLPIAYALFKHAEATMADVV